MPGKTEIKRAPKKKLTDEELLALRKSRQAEREADLKVADDLAKRLPTMTDQQLRAELRRVARGERSGKNIYRPGLRIAFATVLSAVFDNTKTPTNPKGRLHAYPL
jgi:hypothetical protein